MPESSSARIQQIIRNLEGVLKTTSNDVQRKRVYKEIQQWKEELDKLPRNFLFDNDTINFDKDVKTEKSNPLDNYELLKHIPIIKVNSEVNNRELNEIYTFTKYFEDEYLGMLSEYHIKLDFNYSHNRDIFYSQIHDVHLAIKSYADVLEKANKSNIETEQKSRLKLTAQGEYRNVINKISDFYNKLFEFVNNLVDNYDNHGNLISNPKSKLHFNSNVNSSMVLEGCTVIEGVKDLHRFLTELLDYLNLPNIKKKDKID
ncbi:MAG: hypothetical protein OEV44_05880 [Spirochaetota bacterium]|nr:hypothetical protein [Spirochaetota bacterium]